MAFQRACKLKKIRHLWVQTKNCVFRRVNRLSTLMSHRQRLRWTFTKRLKLQSLVKNVMWRQKKRLTTVINYTDSLNVLHSPQVAHNWFCMLYLHIVHAAFDQMANQHWKRRINALISLSSRQHAVSLISIRYGNDLETTGSQVDDHSVTILNNTERPVNVYVSVSWSKVNTDRRLAWSCQSDG